MKSNIAVCLWCVASALAAGSGTASPKPRVIVPNAPPLPAFNVRVSVGHLLTTSGPLHFYSADVASAEIPYRGGGGPIWFWDNPKTGTLIQLNDALSTLDLLSQVEGERGAKGTGAISKASQQEIILNALGFFDTGGAVPLGGVFRNNFLWGLSNVVSKEEFGRLLVLMPDPEITFSGKDWKVSYSVVTGQKAIERRTYSGGLDPITFKRAEVEVIAPPGAVPKFSVLPCPDGWQPGNVLK